MTKKIAVLGTGANGSCVAADLTNAGLDVVLIDQWPAHVEAMRANGLYVTLRQGEIHAKVRLYKDLLEKRAGWQQRVHATLFHLGAPAQTPLLGSDPERLTRLDASARRLGRRQR